MDAGAEQSLTLDGNAKTGFEFSSVELQLTLTVPSSRFSRMFNSRNCVPGSIRRRRFIRRKGR